MICIDLWVVLPEFAWSWQARLQEQQRKLEQAQLATARQWASELWVVYLPADQEHHVRPCNDQSQCSQGIAITRLPLASSLATQLHNGQDFCKSALLLLILRNHFWHRYWTFRCCWVRQLALLLDMVQQQLHSLSLFCSVSILDVWRLCRHFGLGEKGTK